MTAAWPVERPVLSSHVAITRDFPGTAYAQKMFAELCMISAGAPGGAVFPNDILENAPDPSDFLYAPSFTPNSEATFAESE